jgi:hypothetical protein
MIYGVVVTGLKNFQVGSGSCRIRTVNNWPPGSGSERNIYGSTTLFLSIRVPRYQLFGNFSIWYLTRPLGSGTYGSFGATAGYMHLLLLVI